MRGFAKTGKSMYTSKYPFSTKIYCGICGAKYRRAVWGTGKAKHVVWRCYNREVNGAHVCSAKIVKEKELEAAFLRVLNRLIADPSAFNAVMMANIEAGIEAATVDMTVAEIDQRLNEL